MRSISTTKHVLAVVAVTTALCADQAVVAAPAARPQAVEIGQIASRLVSRLAQNFRQVMPSALRERACRDHFAEPAQARVACTATASVRHVVFSPFQFRLPPPVL